MSVLYIALPLALLLGSAALVACVMSIRSGQYDDLESPAVRVLIDEVDVRETSDSRRSVSPDSSNSTFRT